MFLIKMLYFASIFLKKVANLKLEKQKRRRENRRAAKEIRVRELLSNIEKD